MTPLPFDPTRRHFMRQACCAAVGTTGFLSALAQLRLIGAMASDSLSTRASAIGNDYKALVCLFLAGGNDSNNLIVPADASSYAAYAAGRTILALPQSSLLSIKPRTSDGRTYGLHPSLAGIQSLFGQNKAAVLANVGTLVQPVNLAQYKTGAGLPPQLFSHSDQQVQWQSSVPDQPFTSGWGGRLADLVNSMNTNNRISMSISLNGANSFQVGNSVSQYAMSPNGAPVLTGTSATGTNGLKYQAKKDLLSQSQASLFQTAFGGITGGAITDSELLSSVLASPAYPISGTSSKYTTKWPAGNAAADQLKMVANLIAAATGPSPAITGLQRQIFFCRLGGWDTHAAQVAKGDATTGEQADLLTEINDAISAFYSATVELGVANQVTTFTASDFSRTLTTNGDGSDHGWGGHHLVVGGAVKGGDVYGTMPSFVLGGNSPDDIGRGRWIPTTSVDEYSATLASWFGVSGSNLTTVLPNIGRFSRPNLGFMG